MAITERLALIIDADGKGAIRELQKVGDTAERSLGKAESKIDQFAAGMTSAGTKMMAAGAVIGAGMWAAGDAAAALEQAVGGSSAVFGEYEATITEFAEGADAAAGLSERAARELTSSMGAILQGFGFTQEEAAKTSVELAQLGADLAATFGGAPEEAVTALGAALRGEFDPLERFGISLSAAKIEAEAMTLGLAKSKGEIDSNAKAQAALSLITKQSSMAQGQFGREADTTAGRLAITRAEFENATAQLGAGFLPVMSKVAGMASNVIGRFVELDAATGGAIATMMGMAAPILGVGGALLYAGGQAVQFVRGLQASAAAGSAASAAMLTSMGPLTVAAAALAASWLITETAMKAAEDRAKSLGDTVKAAASDDSPEELRAKFGAINDQIGELGDTIDNSSAPWDRDFRAELAAGGKELERTNQGIATTIGQMETLSQATGDSEDTVLEWLRAEEAAGRVYGSNEEALAAYRAAIDAAAGSTGAATLAEAGSIEKLKEKQAELEKLIAKVDEYHGRLLGETQLQADWEAALDGVSESVGANGLAWDYQANMLDLSSAAGRSNWDALTAAAKAAVDQGQAVRNAGGSATEAAAATNTYANALRDRMTHELGVSDTQANALLTKLGLMPAQTISAFYMPGLTEAYGTLAAAEAALARLTAAAQTITVGGKSYVDPHLLPRAPDGTRAAGGPVRAGGTYLVGEEGPELVKFGQSGEVIPAGQTRDLLSGSVGSGPSEATVIVELSGEVLLRALAPLLRDDARARVGVGGMS